MLSHLSIRHYALIDQLEIDFDSRLNIITGETGSGKSIILGALALILGERADTKVVRTGHKKCVVEASFKLNDSRWKYLFEDNDLDFEPVSILRREILSSGKSRAFVNDTPVNLKVMKDIGLELLDIHSQHETIRLNDAAFQLNVIDAYAGSSRELQDYQDVFEKYSKARTSLETMNERLRDLLREVDFIKFQLNEFQEARLDEWDEEELEEEFQLLSNAEEIAQKLQGASELLSEGNEDVLSSLKQASEQLQDLSGYSQHYRELQERLESARIEIDDIAREVALKAGQVEVDPGRLEVLNQQRSVVFRLEKKHGVQGLGALKKLRDELSSQIRGSEELEEEIKEVEKQEKALRNEVLEKGKALSAKRKSSLDSFSEAIVHLLQSLNISRAIFKTELFSENEPSALGLDKIEMKFSANPGSEPQPLKKVASGGELSRLMLSIKRLSGGSAPDKTIILDEIDTGVSGEVANAMGLIMKEMSSQLQVISITHLPQIASKGDVHFKVSKVQKEKTTSTEIARLEGEERVQEIAQMLSGARTTNAALENARDLLTTN